ncbi:MAG: hypothetical protein U1D00_26650 [Mycobacterium sp.]|nr:hypothetical protein [Mycobacterium sp.]
MKRSARAMLTTGVAALSVGAVVTTPSVPPEALRAVLGVRPATVVTDIAPLISSAQPTLVSEAELETALALIEQLTPVTDGRLLTVGLGSSDKPGTATVAPSVSNEADVVVRDSVDGLADVQSLDNPAPLNAASNIIDAVYSVTRYWANYVSLELGPWLINWVPFGYLVSDQISIWYPNFVLPVVDSFVYDFLDPVVNDPLNLGVWLEGIGDIVNTAVTGVYNGVVSEIDYVLSFGWFPIPLPPLPDFPLPGLASDTTPAAMTLASSEVDAEPAELTDESVVADDTGETTAEQVDTDETDTATEDPAEAPAEQGQTDPATLVDGVDEAAEEGTSESSIEEGEETPDAPNAAEESGDTDPSGDEGAGGAEQDGESGSGENSADSNSDDAGAPDSNE